MHRYTMCLALAFATLTMSAGADDTLKDTIDGPFTFDRAKIAGKWTVVGLVVNGNESKEEDARRLTVVNRADGTWSLWSEGEMVSKGTSTIDPLQKPKTIDFHVIDDDKKSDIYRGIYQLRENKRKLCFAPEGEGRPTKFVSKPGSNHILVTFQRVTGDAETNKEKTE